MVVAGPNGCGKSTLLNAIRSNASYKNVVYVGPHRAMRKQVVQQRHLMAAPLSFENILSSQNVTPIEGIRIFDGIRDPWGYDESANFLKHTLCQLEVDRHQAITARVDRDGEIQKDSLVDPWKPLRELTHSLLPHMIFERIDASDRDKVQVLFRVHRLDQLVDLDELSSGEKSIIQMFYPLVEREIKSLVRQIEVGPEGVTERPDFCVLIDEPELHLHPNLQVKVLDYLRVLSADQRSQVIVATHSPTIVEGATFDELFLLRPIELVQDEENQLVRVANDDDKLTGLRSLFGSTHNLTSLQPVIVVEGAADEASGHTVSDRRLYRALHPGFDRVTVISGGGKRECISLVKSLRPALAQFSRHLQVVGLVDKDTGGESDLAVTPLPVSMIENFLLDPDVLFEAIESVLDRTGLRTVEDVSSALNEVLTDSEVWEVERRVAASLGPSRFFPPSKVASIGEAAGKFVTEVQTRYSDGSVESARLAASAAVDGIRTRQRRREEFHGKNVLTDFFKNHLHAAGLSRAVFTFYAAKRARRRRAVVEFFDRFFSQLAE